MKLYHFMKMGRTGDYHAEQDKPSLKSQNMGMFLLIYSSKIMMMMVMGHECTWGTVLKESEGGGRRKGKGEEDGSVLHIYE
jgi:hypothetical protein